MRLLAISGIYMCALFFNTSCTSYSGYMIKDRTTAGSEWRARNANDLRAGRIDFNDFESNLEAYAISSNNKYMEAAAQTAKTTTQKKELECAVLGKLGSKLVSVTYDIDQGGVNRVSKETSLLGGWGYEGSSISPKATAIVTLDSKVARSISYRHDVNINFSVSIPRKRTDKGIASTFMGAAGLLNLSTAGCNRTITIGPGFTSEVLHLDYGSLQLSGKYGERGLYEVAGEPTYTHKVSRIEPQSN